MSKKKCKSDEILNPASNRCVKKTGQIGKKLLAEAQKKIKKCKDDEILNPASNRCVKRTGAIGKKIIEQQNEDKILNPETNRWVKRDGAIGRKILEKQKNMAIKFYPGYKIKYKGKNGVITARYGGVVKNLYEIKLNNGEIKDFVAHEDITFVSEK